MCPAWAEYVRERPAGSRMGHIAGGPTSNDIRARGAATELIVGRLLMARRHTRLVGVAGIAVFATALASGGVAPQASAAPAGTAASLAQRFTKAPAGSAPLYQPPGLSSKTTTVMLELTGDPVAVVDAEEGLTASGKRAHRSALREKQKPVESEVRDLGGTVLADYQSAYNGIKVRASAKTVAKLAALPGVVGVHKLTVVKPLADAVEPSNVRGVPLVTAPEAWSGVDGVHGEGVKVAVIDTGVDYTHADFGGPGTVEAFEAAEATSAEPADPALFGPDAPKVKGGYDFVGDDYNADPASDDYQPVPHPDENPLDCYGHGTHVAGTAAGFGVLSDGSTYTGPYDTTTISGHDWNVGPGVAPEADVYALRVFGCEGSTDVVVDAIEWSVEHDMDVINMSLGSDFGPADSPDAVAADNAAKAGVIVVASSGNSGPAPYITGSPASGDGTLSVAASDPSQTFPGVAVALSTGTTVDAVNANAAELPSAELPVKVLMDGGAIALGCDPADYVDVEGAIVVTRRGTCARVARAVYGQQAGAAAVIMVNSDDSFPPYEGPITGNPDDGSDYEVTIPFLGVRQSDGPALVAADGGTAQLSDVALDNPGYLGIASFSSAGPRLGDSALKPDVTAPGVSIFSAGIGTGDGYAVSSGTSMAAPHAAGVAALVRQAHPTWSRASYARAAITNTADPGRVAGFDPRQAGAGLADAADATETDVVALTGAETSTVNFGFAELGRDFVKTRSITLKNLGSSSATFTVGTDAPEGSPHAVSVSRSRVTVAPHRSTRITVKLSVPAASAGSGEDFADVSGLVTFTPVGGSNHGVALSTPYYLVPRAVSNVDTRIDTRKLVRDGSAVATVTNRRAPVTGYADWYAWGLSDKRERANGSADVQAVGVQAFPGVLAFAISTHERWSSASVNEFDILVDVNADEEPDYAVVGVDLGLVTTGSFDGTMATAVFDLTSGDGSIEFLASAPTDSSSLVLPVLIDQLCTTESACLSEENPRFTYQAVSYGLLDADVVDDVSGTASFNAFSPAITTGLYTEVEPNASVREDVAVDATEWAQTPPLGLMVVSQDDPAGDEAQLIPVKVRP